MTLTRTLLRATVQEIDSPAESWSASTTSSSRSAWRMFLRSLRGARPGYGDLEYATLGTTCGYPARSNPTDRTVGALRHGVRRAGKQPYPQSQDGLDTGRLPGHVYRWRNRGLFLWTTSRLAKPACCKPFWMLPSLHPHAQAPLTARTCSTGSTRRASLHRRSISLG